MLRPATPLSVLLLAAFGLLLVSVISTPIIKAIPLATFGGVDFGVFGFCQGSKCSNIEIGYSTSSLFTATQAASFDLPTGTRATLSAILIVHPIAAFFTLIMLVLAGSAHFHSPSHSPRFLLGIFILSIITLVLSLLAFLIDVLLFVPHMSWGSYLVLAATVLIAASGIVSCAMRRTLVSRKARKRRIAENAEMNGENFYNRQGTGPTVPGTTVGTTSTMVTGGLGDKPTFATFVDVSKKEGDSDEQIPLTSARTPSARSPNSRNGEQNPEAIGLARNQSPPRDQYGNIMPMPPPGAYGMRSRDPSSDPSLRRQYSENSMRGRGGMPPNYRGRGGYPPPNGRGGYGPPGPGRGGFYGPNGRGGYNGPPRGGYGPQNGRGGYSPPRGGYPGGPGRMNDGMRPMAPGAMMAGGRGPPPNYGPPTGRGYTSDGSPPRGPPGGYDDYGPPKTAPAGGYIAYPGGDDDRSSLPRAESPPPLPGLESEGPVGQAIEMDATTGSPSAAPKGFGQFGGIRESDGDVAGMIGLQQRGLPRQTLMSETSRYSSDEPYVPPRAAWGDRGPPGRQGSPLGREGSPLNPAQQTAGLPNIHRRSNSDNYYEDVDPRFAEAPMDPNHPSLVPTALHPPYGAPPGNDIRTTTVGGLDGNRSYEDIQEGARSPAESERSTFTSVSQRGINPRWNGPNGGGYGAPVPRRPVQRPDDLLLNSNPDFQLPGGRGGKVGGIRGGRGNPGMMGQGPYPGRPL
ncbi:hypothetical protein BP6252_09072 [Coleophoma cylindrospora]|uniref:Pali-domain-containing protein n=1 Tax=Coleophoma cylindrospora TaxID=1849047 RepID=A0A3D8R0X3_9HELO|nr:hypothetical protein BP6252_09072 [Coleophoma cylindrospora]